MKNLLRLLVILVLIIGGVSSVEAQNYRTAAGLRAGYPISITFKHFLNETSAVELFASYRNNTARFVGVNYGWSWIGIGGSYLFHAPLEGIDGLTYFYGGGASVQFYTYDGPYYEDEDNISIGVHGKIGLDYGFDDIPLNVSLDWAPTIYIGGYSNGFGAGYGALSVRYILSR